MCTETETKTTEKKEDKKADEPMKDERCGDDHPVEPHLKCVGQKGHTDLHHTKGREIVWP